MDNELSHFGVMGMRWGRRKAADTSPGHEDHERAVKNNTWAWQSKPSARNAARKRLRLEKLVTRVQERSRFADKTPAKKMSDDDIKAFLKNPTMKKPLSEIRSDDSYDSKAKAKIMTYALLAGYWAVRSGGASALLKGGMRQAIKIKNAARYVNVKSNVVDAVWNG